MDDKDSEINKNIYENLNIGTEVAVKSEMPIIKIGDYIGHVGFLGSEERNYNGIKMLGFMERWNLIMMNCDVKCKGTFIMVEGNNESVIDYVLNDKMYQYYQPMEISEGKLLYDL